MLKIGKFLFYKTRYTEQNSIGFTLGFWKKPCVFYDEKKNEIESKFTILMFILKLYNINLVFEYLYGFNKKYKSYEDLVIEEIIINLTRNKTGEK